jgi:predicted acylesterase/phospholipase RssA
MADTETVGKARRFLAGEDLQFEDAKKLWKQLKKDDELALARRILERMREEPKSISDGVPGSARDELCQQEALLTSKDPELSAAVRHDMALGLLRQGFTYLDKKDPADKGGPVARAETLGIAGGICKRRWNDLGQLKDLLQAGEFYQRGAQCEMGEDAYPHINAAFVEDLLAAAGDDPVERRNRAEKLRKNILEKLPARTGWFNTATRIEALFGLKRYDEATALLGQVTTKPDPWELRTMAEQHVQLAHLHEERPLEVEKIRTFFETLLPKAVDAVPALMIGKVGLALSGGGFRASYYHLGVLACLAERNVLRDVEVLSCVSGGSIVGACYWLKLREWMLKGPMVRESYIDLVHELIGHFDNAVQGNVRAQVQPYVAQIAWRFLRGVRGVLDPERIAVILDKNFYRPLLPGSGPLLMGQLAFQPPDHDHALTGSKEFNPAKHNWLRANKVPALILNATTVNTGHAWHFTPTWMGESPWAIHESADSIPRLEWSAYNDGKGWKMPIGRAVAASAGVPTVFAPLRLGQFYHEKDVDVTLVDGGVHDNQGTVALLASSCNVVLVSDACGQLMLERAPPKGLKGLIQTTMRPTSALMERVRLASYADLDSRRRSGLLRGLMFLHMKAGLDADVIRLSFSREAYTLRRAPLSPSGVSKDFQQALAELRTDLDAFDPVEADGLMACGYQMASKALDRQLPKLNTMWTQVPSAKPWRFQAMLAAITSVTNTTKARDDLLATLRKGNKVDFLGGSPLRSAWKKVKSLFG